MITKNEVLEYIARQAGLTGSTSAADIMRRFRVSPTAAVEQLRRLWRAGLVEPTRGGPRYRLDRFSRFGGDRLWDVRFKLAEKGRKRLEYWQDEDSEELQFE
jgi:DNA-binding IclR family transcriptional regulator